MDRSFQRGYCGSSWQPKISYIGPHLGEEPPITGKNGSGTVFFAGCGLRCSYCQNYQISHVGIGKVLEDVEVLEKISEMIETYHVHNVNWVTFDQYAPHVVMLSDKIKTKFEIPIVANLSGYQSVETLQLLENYVDIYLPDFKYSDPILSKALSNAPDYPEVALNAIYEMIKQKGMLTQTEDEPNKKKLKGVLLRHLILPGHVENSTKALDMLFCEFGKDMPISLMSQYYPILPQKYPELNRQVLRDEFQRVLDHCLELGFERIYVQYPEDDLGKLFLPDFERDDPFQITLSKGQEKTFNDLSPSLSHKDLRAS